MWRFFLLVPLVTACTDYDSIGCQTRARIPGFCKSSWAWEKCCSTCSQNPASDEMTGCSVPKNKCATWSCTNKKRDVQPYGASCVVTASQSKACQRCTLVDDHDCTPFTNVTKTCLQDGTWDGPSPSCRQYCDRSYVLPSEVVAQATLEEVEEIKSKLAASEGIKVVDIGAAPFGSFLAKKGVNKYMTKRIDVFGHWFVLFTDACEKKWGDGPALGVANQYAQWLDWEGTGKPNNPKVFANLLKTNATMVMFKKDGNKAMDKFFEKYPFDEDPFPDNHWFHPHDTGCDETPHADPSDKNSFDNAYCEVVQQLFNEGYRPAYPDVFLDQKGSKVANAMEKNIGDCGYAFDHTFKYPHCTGKYHYSDKTCDYQCLFSEYEYWALTSLLGGQDGSVLPPSNRCKDIADEWESCSKEQLEKNDPDIVAIMTDPQYGLPTKLAHGPYTPKNSRGMVSFFDGIAKNAEEVAEIAEAVENIKLV